jgi:hypothetical protein
MFSRKEKSEIRRKSTATNTLCCNELILPDFYDHFIISYLMNWLTQPLIFENLNVNIN